MLKKMFLPVLAALIAVPAGSAPVAILNGINGSEGVLEFNYSYEGNGQVNASVSDFRCSTDGQQTWQDMDVTALTGNDPMLPGEGAFGWDSEELTGDGKAENVYMQFRLQTEAVASGWQLSVPMAQKRYDFDAAEMDGRLYVVCGGANNSTPLSSVEAYDPATGSWSSIAPTATRRKGLGVTVLDGKLYALGGWDGSYHSSMEVYDPATGAWSYTASASGPKVECEVEAGDGKVYVFGGWSKSGNVSIDVVEAYDPATDTWTTKSPMPISRMNFSVAYINGKFYLMGGLHRPGNTFVSQVDVYDPAADSWSTMPNPMPTPAMDAAYCVMDGKAYLAGGIAALGQPYSGIVQIYDPATDSWAVTASQLTSRSDCSGGAVDGKFYVVGGLTQPNHSYTTTSMEVYTAGTGPVYSNYVTGGPLTIDNRSSFTVTASAGTGGSIDPSGDVVVLKGEDQVFAIAADEGYEIADVLVDGESVGPTASFVFENVKETHEISAAFRLKTYLITASAGPNGTIDPAGQVTVEHGGSRSFAMTPDAGYRVLDVTVDGVSVGAVSVYTFENVDGPHSIAASFVCEYTLLAEKSMVIGGKARVTSGVIGVNGGGNSRRYCRYDLSVGMKAEIDEGVTVRADDILVWMKAQIRGDVETNRIRLLRGAEVAGDLTETLDIPLLAEMPAFPPVEPDRDGDMHVGRKQTLRLVPGAYGKITMCMKSTLELDAGDYHFESISSRGMCETRIVCNGPVSVMIAGKLVTGMKSYIGPADGVTLEPEEMAFYVAGDDGRCKRRSWSKACQFGMKSEVKGAFYAPNGTLWLQKGSRARGNFWAENIMVGMKVSVGSVDEGAFAKAGAEEAVPVMSVSSHGPTQNPVIFRTEIRYTVAAKEDGAAVPLRIAVYDSEGRKVKELYTGAGMPGASYSVTWDGKGAYGQPLTNGLYIYRIISAGDVTTGTMILAK